MFPKLPPPACHRRTALQERKHCSRECGRGFPRALMRLASFTHLRDGGLPGFLLLALVSPGRDPAPLGVGLRQHPNSTRGGSECGATQLAPSQLCSLVAALQGLCLPFAREREGRSSPWRRSRVKEAFSQGSTGGEVQSTLVALQNGVVQTPLCHLWQLPL